MCKYALIKGRYSGYQEIEKIVCEGSYEHCRQVQKDDCAGGTFLDEVGNEWYTEIYEIGSEELKAVYQNVENVEQ